MANLIVWFYLGVSPRYTAISMTENKVPNPTVITLFLCYTKHLKWPSLCLNPNFGPRPPVKTTVKHRPALFHCYLEGAGSMWDQEGPSKALFPKHKTLSRSLGAAPPETSCGNSCGVGFFCCATHTLKREQSCSLIQFVHFTDLTIKQVLKHVLTA